jgi:ubiquinone/menaquinone biosynthesis C-methylase UbiE
LLNRAARYFSLLRELKNELGSEPLILEIGSGSIGIGEFLPRSFVGCDVKFDRTPRKPMMPVVASGTQLPFAAKSFDIVISSDVLEHVPPENRESVIAEALRVARKRVLFCFPCGAQAFALDQKLNADYEKRGKEAPIWLQEHMMHPFPDRDLFHSLPDGWKVRYKPSECLSFHDWMMHKEMGRGWDYAFRLVLLIFPRIVRYILNSFDRDPSYRTIFTLIKEGEAG